MVTVLDFGRVIASGTPQDVLEQDDVRAAYLGVALDEDTVTTATATATIEGMSA